MATRVMNSIKNRILLGGLATILLIGVLWLLSGVYYLSRYHHHIDIGERVEDVHIGMLRMRAAQKDFILADFRNPSFYLTGQSPFLTQEQQEYRQLQQHLDRLETMARGSDLKADERISPILEKYNGDFQELVSTARKRGFYSYGLEGRIRQMATSIENTLKRANNLRLQNELLELRRAEKDYLLRGTNQYTVKVDTQVNRLRTLVAPLPDGASIADNLANYENAFHEYRDLTRQIGLTPNDGIRGRLTASINQMENIFNDIEAHAIQNSEQASRQLQWANFLILLFGLILGTGIFSLFAKSLSNPIIALKNAAVEIGGGRLDARVDVRSNDEIGVLGKTFNEMAGNLHRISEELRAASSTLASSAGEILASTTQVAASASETAAAVSQTTATVEQVKQTAQLSNQKARDVADSAQHSAEVSFAGNQSVSEAVAGMERVREQMNSIAESVINLSDQSQAIGDIINTVNDLAEQSNLLAVNAAIEAAKAGEQGKGFAVVAQEVKSLAEQSKQATARVRTILNEIQKATSAAVMSTEQGTKAVEAGLTQAEEAGQSIEGLAHSIEKAAQAALQISASSQEQLIGVDQVALAMNSIKDASTQNVTSMRQLETAARDLSHVGQNLRQLVEQFRADGA